ncbi:MAG TPA: acyltransferase family protein, partial [Patescibacteria group bacterium]|nr:acyltransferase family protein [Patescibacteria group bacterium]
PAFWPLTWIFEVLPLFFFVGGFANYTSYTRPRLTGPQAGFHERRLRRLLQPTLVFLAVWVGIEVVLNLLGAGGDGPIRSMRIGYITPFESLWFLGVYLVVVVLSPATIRLHRRFGAAVPAVLFAAVAVVDAVANVTGVPNVQLANIPLVWLLPHQLGYFYADGRLARESPRRLLAVAAAALVVTALLTSLPFYGRNLIDSKVAILGISAPTVPFAVMCIGVVAGALAARPALNRWLALPRLHGLVGRLNSVVMTVFLWHMTAFFGILWLLYGLGLPMPARPDAEWWWERPLYVILPAVALVPLVWLFARFERSRPAERPAAGPA